MARTRALLPLFIWLAAVAVHGDGARRRHAVAPSPPPTEDCSSALLSLSGCLSFVEEGSSEARPQKRCCSGLNEVAVEQESCLCVAFSQGAAMGVRINMTRALALPSSCAVSVPPLADCKVALGGAPSPSLRAAIAPSPLAGQSSNAAAAPPVSVAGMIGVATALIFYYCSGM
ncbi:non-specific lipid transfer protein GPI-anchored 31-like [Curcuma longa]|uniref:non-specific lipid transfer protein GPI-anchored 31-like n=1 Tax=Curcuma longa TaxID=136217 RepID=UPI003D9EF85A